MQYYNKFSRYSWPWPTRSIDRPIDSRYLLYCVRGAVCVNIGTPNKCIVPGKMPLKFDNNGGQWIRWRHSVSSIVLGPRLGEMVIQLDNRWWWLWYWWLSRGADKGPCSLLLDEEEDDDENGLGVAHKTKPGFIILCYSATHYKASDTLPLEMPMMMMICYKSMYFSWAVSRSFHRHRRRRIHVEEWDCPLLYMSLCATYKTPSTATATTRRDSALRSLFYWSGKNFNENSPIPRWKR